MKTLVAICLVGFCFNCGADTNEVYPRLLIDGKVYSNAHISSVTATHAIVFFDGGGTRVHLTNLPSFLKSKYPYDARKGAAEVEVQKKKQTAIKESNYANAKIREQSAKQAEFVNLYETSYDKFRKLIFVRSRTYNHVDITELPKGLTTLDWSISTGMEPGETVPDFVSINYWSSSKDWFFLKNRTCVIIYDGITKDFGDMEHDGDVEYGGVLERLRLHFSFDEFKKMAFSKSVEIKLGIIEGSYTEPTLEKMRIFVNHFDSLKQPAAEGNQSAVPSSEKINKTTGK
ncbi:MAG: hypothetical protein M3Y82_03320 [Verrucomicrobiota bacterium]|nr:hypothetical protein [Verrucomicrobiota bacterium]